MPRSWISGGTCPSLYAVWTPTTELKFINAELSRYCQQEGLTFTHPRPYRKNDSCFVEQKNWTVVRKTVGYTRYDTEQELALMAELYRSVRLYTNFFLPQMKLLGKTRTGSRVSKRYDEAKTPYRRLLDSEHLCEQEKDALRREYLTLNPVALRREINRLQDRLAQLTRLKEELKKEGGESHRCLSTFSVRQRLTHSSTFLREATRSAQGLSPLCALGSLKGRLVEVSR